MIMARPKNPLLLVRETKRCPACAMTLPRASFGKNVRRYDGLTSMCRDCLSLWQKRRREVNLDSVRGYHRTYQRGYRDAHPDLAEKERESARRWHREHREQSLATARRFLKENPERKRQYDAKSRALRRGSPLATLTRVQWAELKEYFNFRCAYCLESVEVLTQDHIVPVSKGGLHAAENIVPACGSCNSRKRDKSLLQFVALTGGK